VFHLDLKKNWFSERLRAGTLKGPLPNYKNPNFGLNPSETFKIKHSAGRAYLKGTLK
jgi:hypothetical protein